MISAFSRLLLIGVGALFVLVLVLFGLRQVGLQRQFQVFEHPLITNDEFWIIAANGGGRDFPPHTKPAFDEALRLDPNIVLELPLHRSTDGVWFVYAHYKLEVVTDGKGFAESLTWAELQKLNAAFQFAGKRGDFPYRDQELRLLSLEQALQLYPKTRFILTFHDPRANFIQEVATMINSLDISSRIVIRSPFSKFVRELRKVEPMWVYVLDPASLDRAVMLEGLYIETLASLPTDMIISPLTIHGVPILSPKIVKEIKRQKKRLILDVNDFTPTIPRWLIPELDGVLTDRPSWAVKEFRSPTP